MKYTWAWHLPFHKTTRERAQALAEHLAHAEKVRGDGNGYAHIRTVETQHGWEVWCYLTDEHATAEFGTPDARYVPVINDVWVNVTLGGA